MNVSLTKAQYYRNFYSGNENARREESRSAMTKGSLVHADTKALTRAINTFSSIYSSEDLSGKNIYNAIQAFGDTYNNAISSGSNTDDIRAKRLMKNIKSLSSSEKSSLEEIGITVKSSGKLSIDKDKLAKASPNKVKKIFGEDSEFLKKLKEYSRSLGNESTTIDLKA